MEDQLLIAELARRAARASLVKRAYGFGYGSPTMGGYGGGMMGGYGGYGGGGYGYGSAAGGGYGYGGPGAGGALAALNMHRGGNDQYVAQAEQRALERTEGLSSDEEQVRKLHNQALAAANKARSSWNDDAASKEERTLINPNTGLPEDVGHQFRGQGGMTGNVLTGALGPLAIGASMMGVGGKGGVLGNVGSDQSGLFGPSKEWN